MFGPPVPCTFDAVGEDQCACRLDDLGGTAVVGGDLQTKLEQVTGRLHPDESRAVAHRHLHRGRQPGEEGGPSRTRDSIDCVVGVGAVPFLEPGAKAQLRKPELRLRPRLGRAQGAHPRGRGPPAGFAPAGGVDDTEAADTGAAQCESDADARLAATDDHDIVIGVGGLDPIGRRRSLPALPIDLVAVEDLVADNQYSAPPKAKRHANDRGMR
ncbi:MAG TPA: hypothetical protein VIC62_01175 [Nakamurella sp.]|jgi:hypothetical protein